MLRDESEIVLVSSAGMLGVRIVNLLIHIHQLEKEAKHLQGVISGHVSMDLFLD